MKYLIVFFLFAPGLLFAQSETPALNRTEDLGGGYLVMMGKCDEAGLKAEPFSEWYSPAYESYEPRSYVRDILKSALVKKEGLSIEVFMGTWCEDSQAQVPKLMKVLNDINFPKEDLSVICVGSDIGDLYKQSPEHEERGKNIHHVPTIIISQGEKELGRIVEHPLASIESDLSDIIHGMPYKHPYACTDNFHKEISKLNQKEKEAYPEKLATEDNCFSGPNSLEYYAKIQVNEGNEENAVCALRTNIKFFPDMLSSMEMLGEIYERAGNTESALEVYRKALEVSESAYLKNKITELENR